MTKGPNDQMEQVDGGPVGPSGVGSSIIAPSIHRCVADGHGRYRREVVDLTVSLRNTSPSISALRLFDGGCAAVLECCSARGRTASRLSTRLGLDERAERP